ncbi:MAG: fatty-acid synthase [Chloroflexaceae bacterium]|nr:fatty-acid synthase [Chloroflexaceae bacterium]
MPARDIIHGAVKAALIKDGWTITHDPFQLQLANLHFLVDLGAERAIAAEKEGQKIAVEIKSFAGKSPVYALEQAIGQYTVYTTALTRTEPERTLYLAVNERAFARVFDTPAGHIFIVDLALKIIVVSQEKEEVVKWIP